MIFEEIASRGNEKVVVEWLNGESEEHYWIEADASNLEETIFQIQRSIWNAEGIFVPASDFEFTFPPTVQAKIEILEEYTENPELTEFNVMHIHPTFEIAYPDGYYDSRWFKLTVYNNVTMQCRHIDRLLDGIRIPNSMPVNLRGVGVWAEDGSVVLSFNEIMLTHNFDQCTWIVVDNR